MSYKTHSEDQVGGVGKHREKKKRFFFAPGLKFWMAAFILTVPLFFCRGRAENTADKSGETAESENWVDVRLKGAERLDEILELKKRIAELEALERKMRAENTQLTAERNLLKQELFDSINQLEKQNAQFRQLEHSVSGLRAAGAISGAPEREARLVEAVARIAESGRDLAVLSSEFCSEADAIVKSLPAGNLEGVRLRLKIDEVRSASRKFITLSDWRLNVKSAEKCRILAVNADLGFVVLPVGFVHGVFNGLNFYVPGKTAGATPVRLTVIATRSLVAAAKVADGDIRTLSPGSEAVTDLQQTNK